MSRNALHLAMVLVVGLSMLTVGAIPAAGATNLDESPADGPGVGPTTDESPAADGSSGPTSDGDTNNRNATTRLEPFNLRQQNVTKCGMTCRVVTVTLTNMGNNMAKNISVESRIFAGDSHIETRQTTIRRLRPNETVVRTIRIDAGLQDVIRIKQNGGRITVQSTIKSDDHNMTKISQRKIL